MAPPLQLHLGVRNILGATSGLLATTYSGAQGDQALRFDRAVAGSVLPSVITLNNTNGQIVFPAGTWMLCASARGSQTGSLIGQNSRGYFYLSIREGNGDYRHVSSPAYSRWTQGGQGAGSFPTIQLENGGTLATPERNIPMSVSGVVVSDGTTPVTIRMLWSLQNAAGGVEINAAHLHAFRAERFTEADLLAIVRALTSEDTIVDDNEILLVTDDGLRRASISDFPSGGSDPTEAQIAAILNAADTLTNPTGAHIVPLLTSGGALRKATLANARKTDAQINTLIDTRVPASQRKTDAQVNNLIDTRIPAGQRLTDGSVTLAKLAAGTATASQIIKRNEANNAWIYADDASGGGNGGGTGNATFVRTEIPNAGLRGVSNRIQARQDTTTIGNLIEITLPTTEEKIYQLAFDGLISARSVPVRVQFYASELREKEVFVVGADVSSNKEDLILFDATIATGGIFATYFFGIGRTTDNKMRLIYLGTSNNADTTTTLQATIEAHEITLTGSGGGTPGTGGAPRFEYELLDGTNSENLELGHAYQVNISGDTDKPLVIPDTTETGHVIIVARESNGDDTGNAAISVVAGSNTRIRTPANQVVTTFNLGNSGSNVVQAAMFISSQNSAGDAEWLAIQMGDHRDIPSNQDIIDQINTTIPEAERLTASAMYNFINAQNSVDALNIADQFLIADESESAVRRASAAELRNRLIPQAEALFNAIKGFFFGAGATSVALDEANNRITYSSQNTQLTNAQVNAAITEATIFGHVRNIFQNGLNSVIRVVVGTRRMFVDVATTQGAQGRYRVSVYRKVAHNASTPAKPSATSFDGTSFTGLTANWTTDLAGLRATNYDPTTHDIYETFFEYDPANPTAAIVFGDVFKQDAESGPAGVPGPQGVPGQDGSDASVTATAVKNVLAADHLPASSVSTTGLTGNLNGATTAQEAFDDADALNIPNVIDQVLTTNNQPLPDGKIPSEIARVNMVPTQQAIRDYADEQIAASNLFVRVANFTTSLFTELGTMLLAGMGIRLNPDNTANTIEIENTGGGGPTPSPAPPVRGQNFNSASENLKQPFINYWSALQNDNNEPPTPPFSSYTFDLVIENQEFDEPTNSAGHIWAQIGIQNLIQEQVSLGAHGHRRMRQRGALVAEINTPADMGSEMLNQIAEGAKQVYLNVNLPQITIENVQFGDQRVTNDRKWYRGVLSIGFRYDYVA